MRVGRDTVLAAGLTMMVVLSACAHEVSGPASPGTSSASAASTGLASSPASTRVLPPRPRTLDLTGVDPCADVLTGDQLHALAYDLGYQRRPQPSTSRVHGGPACTYSSSRPPDQPSRDIGVLIGISTSEGAERWLTDPARKSTADRAGQVTVAGFPALLLPNPAFVDNCAVVVDVHDRQYLEVSGNPSGGSKGTSPDPYCAEAQRVADMAIATLSARR